MNNFLIYTFFNSSIFISTSVFANESGTDTKAALKKTIEEGGIVTYLVLLLAILGLFYIINTLKKKR